MKKTTSTHTTNTLWDQLTQRELEILQHNFEENDLLISQGKNTISFEPVVKFFNPTGIGTWYLTELSPDHIGFGICCLEEIELGYVSLTALNNLCLPCGLSIEKDATFSANGLTLSQFLKQLHENEYRSLDVITAKPDCETLENMEEKTQALVNRHIFSEQTDLVELCLEENLIPPEYMLNIHSFFDHNGNKLSESNVEEARQEDNLYELYHIEEQNVSSWLLVTEWLAEKLEAKNEPLICGSLGNLWGRITFCQPIVQDSVIQEIAKEYC